MAEFLFRAHNHNAAPGTRLARGDCVVAVENGWPWTQAELTAPQWRIVKVPDMSLDEARVLMAPDPGDPELGHLPQRRKYTVDEALFQLPETAAFVADDSRVAPFMTFTADQLRGVIVQRPPLTG
jgi:hypothetical protein